MSVYVDFLMDTLRSPQWPYDKACHLFADTEEELHVTARAIGLHRSWFQCKRGKLPHYDLNRGMRAKAVTAGAIALVNPEAGLKMREIKQARKETPCLPAPRSHER